MIIVHVVRQFHPAIGGLEGVVKELATAQAAQGHDVRVVTLNRVFNGPPHVRLPAVDWLGDIEIVRIPFFGSKRYPLAFSAIRHIRDADIVHVHAIDFFFDYLAWTVPFHRRKLVVSTHGGFFHTKFATRLKQVYFNTVTRLSLSWYAGVATVGISDDKMFRSIRQTGVCLIENGVDIDKYAGAGSTTPAKSLISLGRFSSNKRLDQVIAFLAALHRRDPQWRLTIAGRPFDVTGDQLREAALRHGMRDYIRIVEQPSDADVRNMISGSSAFVSASDYEGFGLVLIEALSAGLWPVVSSIPPFKHVVEKTGLGTLVDFNDIDTAAKNLLADWTTLSTEYAAVRAASMQAAAAYRWPDVNARYEALYQSVLGQGSRAILDVPILVKTSAEAVDLLDRQFESGTPGVVVFANAHTLNATTRDVRVHSVLGQAIVFNDGIGVDIASRLLFGKAFPENLNGTDFVPRYLRQSGHRHRVFMLGGRPGVAERAALQLLRDAPGIEIAGTSHGYVPETQIGDVLEAIRRSRADILLVAMGNPVQETWLSEHLQSTGCRLGFGVGGLFDFLAGEVPRAPQWVQSARIEWAYRLMQQPARLWRRYLIQMPIFLLRVARQWLTGSRVPGIHPQ